MSLVVEQQVLHADWTWTGRRLERDLAVTIGGDGRIVEVRPAESAPATRLPGRALIPGFVSGHSHAFQRGLRGLTQDFAAGRGGFFPWREAMYALVEELSPDRVYELSKQTYLEMLAAGYTSVGEFHYIRHAGPREAPEEGLQEGGGRYGLDAAVIAAAKDAGIRLLLLPSLYALGGFDRPLAGGQLRFRVRDVREYWERFDALAGMIDPATQSLGACVHSLRAAPMEVIEAIHRESTRRGLVFHMHLEEVRREIEECVALHGRTPSELVLSRLAVDERLTLIHCTHTPAAELAGLAAAGATICVCPLTEGDLGDGICDQSAFRAAGGRLAVGTDLNVRLAPTEELRWLEYVQRVAGRTRGVIVDESGDAGRALLAIGSAGGAHALGLDAGAIVPGKLADFALIDLEHPTLRGWTPETFAAHLIFGTDTSVVEDACVGGRWRGGCARDVGSGVNHRGHREHRGCTESK